MKTSLLLLLTGLLSMAGMTQAETSIVVSVPDQKMTIFRNGLAQSQYDVSTSKFGLSDTPRSYGTPLGSLEICDKIGYGAPEGAVFKGRRPTGEVIRPNAPGRDPIVTRIMWLRGLEAKNSRAHDRAIYIHGTPEERLIGRPASYGCIRMRSRDVVRVFNSTPVGTRVQIVNAPMSRAMRQVALN